MAIAFNKGGFDPSADNSSLGVQINDKFWSKAAIKESKRTRIFSQMGKREVQPKNHGDKLVKYHEYPIMDERNINNEGIDANGVKVLANTWYAYKPDGTREVTGADTDGSTGYSTEAGAKTAANAVGGTIKTGNGNLYGTSKDMSLQNGSFPILSENGGWVNRVGVKRGLVEGTIEEFGLFESFTKRMIDMDTELGLKSRLARLLGEAQGTLREGQIRNSLIGQAEQNRVFSGSATSVATVTGDDTLTFTSLRKMAETLKVARCSKDTKIITGSTKVDTRVVGGAYYAYVPYEARSTLEDMTHNGVSKWIPVEMYPNAGSIADGEIGKIGDFRFIEVEDMPNYSGQGATVASSANTNNSYTTTGADGSERYSVFPILFVGSGSFATIGFEGDSAKVATAMPQIIAGHDAFGREGVVSISWYFGMLYLRPEWIRMINCSLTDS